MHRPLVRRLPHALHAQSRHRLLHVRPLSSSPSCPNQNWTAPTTDERLTKLELAVAEINETAAQAMQTATKANQTATKAHQTATKAHQTAAEAHQTATKAHQTTAKANQTAAEALQMATEAKTESKLLRKDLADLAAVTLDTSLSSYLLLYTFIGLHTYRTGEMEKTDHSNPADDAPLPPHLTLLAFHAHYLSTNKKVHPPPRLNKVLNDANPANTYFFGPVEEREASFKLGFEMAKEQSTTIVSAMSGVSRSMKVDHIAYCVVRNKSESEAMDRFYFSYIFNQTPEQYLLDGSRVKELRLVNPESHT